MNLSQINSNCFPNGSLFAEHCLGTASHNSLFALRRPKRIKAPI